MVLHAHRGDPAAPENSARAIQQALGGAWDGAEIDIQTLGDGAWVLHHDAQLGRTTSLKGRPVASLDSAVWREVRMKDRQGRTTNEPAPFLRDVAQAAAAQGGKVLNIELKQPYGDCRPVQRAVADIHQTMPGGQWFLTAIDRRQLQCARRSDAAGYLGQIVLDAQALAMGSDKRLIRANANRLAPPTIDRAWLARLVQEVGRPVGIHIDTHTLERNPGLLALARDMEVPVFTYGLGSDRDHARALADVRRQSGLLPSGAVINEQAEAFCRMVEAP